MALNSVDLPTLGSPTIPALSMSVTSEYITRVPIKKPQRHRDTEGTRCAVARPTGVAGRRRDGNGDANASESRVRLAFAPPFPSLHAAVRRRATAVSSNDSLNAVF